jgi:hypothetical protein
MSLVHSPHLHFNNVSEMDAAVSYVMLGWFYATMVQMPIGDSTVRQQVTHGSAHPHECRAEQQLYTAQPHPVNVAGRSAAVHNRRVVVLSSAVVIL